MAKFRKKPVVIEAEQWFPGKQIEGVVGTQFDNPGTPESVRYGIKTLEGWMNVSPGDWIITGVMGERYPCKPDVFAATYESEASDPTILSRPGTFGWTLERLKAGARVARRGWNGKGMWLYHVPAGRYPALTMAARQVFGDEVPYGAYIAMKTAQGNVVPWLASQTDMLADDWEELP